MYLVTLPANGCCFHIKVYVVLKNLVTNKTVKTIKNALQAAAGKEMTVVLFKASLKFNVPFQKK